MYCCRVYCRVCTAVCVLPCVCVCVCVCSGPYGVISAVRPTAAMVVLRCAMARPSLSLPGHYLHTQRCSSTTPSHPHPPSASIPDPFSPLPSLPASTLLHYSPPLASAGELFDPPHTQYVSLCVPHPLAAPASDLAPLLELLELRRPRRQVGKGQVGEGETGDGRAGMW